ncbi:MAG TPA: hypothetical protein VN690_05730 [Terriglobales bacterium]|nr:hypothetical protein [Terriglobales bacterium]
MGKLAAMPADADPQKQAKFKAAMNLAISLAEKNPAPAAQAADIAPHLMTDDLLAANYERVALLAARMGVNLHQNAEADDLLKRCLDLAEANARKAEEAYDGASPDDWGRLAGDFQGIGSPEVETFTFAAMADPTLAETRAEQTSAAYFKPMFLLRVALGQELQKPWWK